MAHKSSTIVEPLTFFMAQTITKVS